MTLVGLSAPLQDPVNRFARALSVPRRLLALHPRKRGNPGDAGALAPSITLGVISAFEGFVEEFVAVGAMTQGLGIARIAKAVGKLNNPDVAVFEKLLVGHLGVPKANIGVGFSVTYWVPPSPGTTWWQWTDLDWPAAKSDAEAWMQVRHSITHGATSGWWTERWPPPLQENVRPASSVLRETSAGLHTLVIHGAISCARIYVEASRHLAALTAQHLGETIDLDVLPDFPLHKEQASESTPLPVPTTVPAVVNEPVDEGDEGGQLPTPDGPEDAKPQ